MAGLMARLSMVIKSKFSKLLDRAEDPGETLDYSYERQIQLLQNVKRGIADVATARKRIELQTTQLEQSVVKLETQARQALAAGREDLARQGLDTQLEGLQAQQDKLVSSEKQLSAKVEAFRSQKEVIKAQYSAAEAQVRIGEAASGIGEQMADTGLAIQRAKDKTEQMQARAAAVDELVEAGTLEDFSAGGETPLDRELAALASSSEVDADLERLKAEVGAGQGSKALEAGDEETLDRHLEEMWALVKSEGKELPAESLEASDCIVPPADLTLEETRALFDGEGLIPDLPV